MSCRRSVCQIAALALRRWRPPVLPCTTVASPAWGVPGMLLRCYSGSCAMPPPPPSPPGSGGGGGGGGGGTRSMAEVIAHAIVRCNFDPSSTPFAPEDLSAWLQRLQDDEGVSVVADLDAREAPEILRRVGVKNAKLRSAIVAEAFPSAAAAAATGGSGDSYDEEKWNKLVDEIQKFKREKKWYQLIPKLMKEIDKLSEVPDEPPKEGVEDQTHPFYLPCLFQELAQAQFNVEMYESALEANASAMAIYSSGDVTHKVMEALEFQGVIYAAMEHTEAAALSFAKILEWAEEFGKKSSSPVEAYAARELTRTSQSHYGKALVQLQRYPEAEAVLSACLAPNAEANDFWATLRTLRALMACFLTTRDVSRYDSTLQRALLWCDRHKKVEAKAELAQEEEERKANQATAAAAAATAATPTSA